MRTWNSKAAVALVVVMIAAACGSGDGGGDTATTQQGQDAPELTTGAPETVPPTEPPKYSVVRTDGVSGPDIENITVWAPDAAGKWPVALLLPGWSETADHYTLMAEGLAGEGVVVFAPDYRARAVTGADPRDAFRDAECAYRHMRTLAEEYGGSLTRPVTVVGHSLGGIVGLGIGLNGDAFAPDGPFDRCPETDKVPRPDRVVALSSCYFESPIDGTRFPFDPTAYGWTHFDADINLVVGAEDEECAPWQAQDAMEALIEDGFENVGVTVIDGAGHFDVMFQRWEGDCEWWEPCSEWFYLPGDPAGVAAVQAMLDTIMEPGFTSADSYAAWARQYCEAWPDVATLLADDVTYAEVPADGLSVPDGDSYDRGLSEDLITGSAAVLAALDSTEQPQVECSEAVTVSGDWVAVPYTATSAEDGAQHQGIWVLRITGEGIHWHLAYSTSTVNGEEVASFDDPVVAAEARDYCAIVEGFGKVRDQSEVLAAMTDDPGVVNLPEGFYFLGTAEVEAMVRLYPPELRIQCSDDIVTSGGWSAHPALLEASSIGMKQVGMWVYAHRDGRIHRQFAHYTRASGRGAGLPWED